LPDIVDGKAVTFDEANAEVVVVIRVGDAGEMDKLKQDQAENERAEADQQEFMERCDAHEGAL